MVTTIQIFEPVKLTRTQAATMVFLRDYVRGHGYPPTLRELVVARGWSLKSYGSAASAALKILERKGMIERTSGSRCLRIVLSRPT